MPEPMNAQAVLDREYLEMRARILELAACLDRLDRGEGDVGSDDRKQVLIEGIKILLESDPDRAERVQLLFSREYQTDWQQAFGVLQRQ